MPLFSSTFVFNFQHNVIFLHSGHTRKHSNQSSAYWKFAQAKEAAEKVELSETSAEKKPKSIGGKITKIVPEIDLLVCGK